METVLNKSTPYPRDLSVKIFSRTAVLKKKNLLVKLKIILASINLSPVYVSLQSFHPNNTAKILRTDAPKLFSLVK